MPRKFIALFAQRLSVLCCVVAGGGFASLSPAAAAVAIGISSLRWSTQGSHAAAAGLEA